MSLLLPKVVPWLSFSHSPFACHLEISDYFLALFRVTKHPSGAGAGLYDCAVKSKPTIHAKPTP
jgi:hypothetical protein